MQSFSLTSAARSNRAQLQLFAPILHRGASVDLLKTQTFSLLSPALLLTCLSYVCSPIHLNPELSILYERRWTLKTTRHQAWISRAHLVRPPQMLPAAEPLAKRRSSLHKTQSSNFGTNSTPSILERFSPSSLTIPMPNPKLRRSPKALCKVTKPSSPTIKLEKSAKMQSRRLQKNAGGSIRSTEIHILILNWT